MSCAEVSMKVCSICLSIGTDFSLLETKFKSLVHSIAPEMRLEISETSFGCSECLKKLVDLYYFKSLYLDSEEKVRNKVSETGDKISILQVVYPFYILEGGNDYIVNICRICLTVINSENFSTMVSVIQGIPLGDMLLSAMPELLVDLTYNPIFCEPCTAKVVDMYVFNRRCLETENKIKSYLENTGTTVDEVNKSSLLLNVLEHFMETKDNKLTVYDCDCCDFKTFKADDLKRHKHKHMKSSKMKKAKSNAKPYKCTICNSYATNKKNNLTKHMARHTKQSSQTFLCSTCDFQTNSKFDLKKHTAEQHSEKDNTSFLCPKCSYTSTKRRNLSKHLARHRKKEKQSDDSQIFKCSSCSFDTKIKYDLTRHMLIHKKPSESVMYKCKICPYQTNRKDNLSIHNVRHKCQETTSNDEEVEN